MRFSSREGAIAEPGEGFELFVAVVDAGSISAASRALELPRETVSRALARLEQRLGVRLLHRGTRQLVLTRAGEALYARARPIVLAAREAEAAVRQLDEVPRGLLRVSVPPGGGAFLAEALFTFRERFPEVALEILATDRHVDLVAERFDVALRAGTLRDPGLVARRLWAGELVAVAARAYLDRRGCPRTLDDLAGHACLLGYEAGLRPARVWPTRDGGTVTVAGPLVSNDLALLEAAAAAGAGIALLPRAALADPRLEEVLPELLGGPTSLAIVFVERRFMDPKVRAFVDHVVAWFEARAP